MPVVTCFWTLWAKTSNGCPTIATLLFMDHILGTVFETDRHLDVTAEESKRENEGKRENQWAIFFIKAKRQAEKDGKQSR